jgi:hypothetical protein
MKVLLIALPESLDRKPLGSFMFGRHFAYHVT